MSASAAPAVPVPPRPRRTGWRRRSPVVLCRPGRAADRADSGDVLALINRGIPGHAAFLTALHHHIGLAEAGLRDDLRLIVYLNRQGAAVKHRRVGGSQAGEDRNTRLGGGSVATILAEIVWSAAGVAASTGLKLPLEAGVSVAGNSRSARPSAGLTWPSGAPASVAPVLPSRAAPGSLRPRPLGWGRCGLRRRASRCSSASE